MIDPEFLDHLSRFNLIVQKRVTSNYIGTRESLATGGGLVFADHQQYAPGDDFRHIDWKVFGRTDKLYVRRFEEERALTVHIMIDTSASMNFKEKWDYAASIGIGFSYLTMRENEKLQLSTFSDDVKTLRPRKGRAQLAQMVDTMNNMRLKGNTNFISAMQVTKKATKSKSMIVVISDFMFDAQDIDDGLAMLGTKHDVKVVMVLDKDEKNLNFQGEYKFIDAETETQLQTYVSTGLKESYKSRLDKHISKVAEIAGRQKAEFHLVTTEESVFDSFYKVLHG